MVTMAMIASNSSLLIGLTFRSHASTNAAGWYILTAKLHQVTDIDVDADADAIGTLVLSDDEADGCLNMTISMDDQWIGIWFSTFRGFPFVC
jgi:hypothetical protein